MCALRTRSAPTRVGRGAWGEGRDVEVPRPSPHKPQKLACGLDFGSRYVKLVYSRKQGGWGRRKVDSIVFYRDYLVRA